MTIERFKADYVVSQDYDRWRNSQYDQTKAVERIMKSVPIMLEVLTAAIKYRQSGYDKSARSDLEIALDDYDGYDVLNDSP